MKLIENYAHDQKLVNAFHEFISKVFPSISFIEWHSKGFWSENFVSHSLIKSGKIISNVCATKMSLIINGEKMKAIQIGAVGTLEDYRNKGLSKKLMDYVIEKYKKEYNLFFLFANETVMNFYPKFGFKNIKEKVFISNCNFLPKKSSIRKIDIKDESDFNLVVEMLETRLPLTNIFGAENYKTITMWYVFNIYSDNIYYLKDEHIVLILKEENQGLHIFDVIFCYPINFEEILPKIATSESIQTIKYYFPPDILKYNYDKTINDNSGLFIRGPFNLNSELIKFPETAHT